MTSGKRRALIALYMTLIWKRGRTPEPTQCSNCAYGNHADCRNWPYEGCDCCPTSPEVIAHVVDRESRGT